MKDINTEINKIKAVLVALWKRSEGWLGGENEAVRIIDEFKEELDEIERGN